MRHGLFLTAIALLAGALFGAESWFDAYTAGNYAAARDALEKEAAVRPYDPLVRYNLGVTAEKEGRRGEAIFNYLQALQAAPDLKEARNNLDLLAGDLRVTVPRRLLEPSDNARPDMILFFVSFYLFTLVLLWHLFRPDWKRRLALVPLFMLMALFAFLFASRYREQRTRCYAVALSADTLRSGPDGALSAVGSVREGEVVELGDASGGWAKVHGFQDNVEGWVPAPQIRHITRRME